MQTMRLLTKTTIWFLTIMIALFAISGIYVFRQFAQGLDDRNDKELIGDELQWINYLETQTGNGIAFVLRASDITIYPVDLPADSYPIIRDGQNNIGRAGLPVPYRELSQVVSVRGINYRISIRRSQEQKAALVVNFTRIIII